MKKYSFRLEQVRRVRITQEEVAKATLLSANNDVAAAEQFVETCKHEFERANTIAVPGQSFVMQRQIAELKYRAVLNAQSAADAAQAVAEEKRALWAVAAMKVKVLDRLDERKHAEYDIDYNRDLDKELDDVVTGRFGAAS